MGKRLARFPSNMDPVSEFVVDAPTPTLGGGPSQLTRALTMEATQVDFVDMAPEIMFKLLEKKMLFYVVTTVLFFGAFTTVAYIGVHVETMYEPIGSSEKSEARVEILNTYSGYVMAFIETVLDMYMSTFLPVLLVYVYNKLYFLRAPTQATNTATGQTIPASKFSRISHRAILIALPIVIALTLGNSLRGLQAGQSSEGFKSIMVADDLKKEQPVIDRIRTSSEAKKGSATGTPQSNEPKVVSVKDTILRNAILQRSTPFELDTKSHCGTEVKKATGTEGEIDLSAHQLDSTSAVYGFVAQEWNVEAITKALKPITSFTFSYENVTKAQAANTTLPAPNGFPISTAFDIVLQGKMVIERAQGYAITDTYRCSLSDGKADQDPNANDAPTRHLEEADTSRKLTRRVLNTITSRTQQRRLETETVAPTAPGNTGFYDDDSENQWSTPKGIRMCQGAVSSLFEMDEFLDPSRHTAETLVTATARAMSKTLSNLTIKETTIVLETYNLTEQIQLEVVRIDIPIDTTVDYALCESTTTCDTYSYENLARSFCGTDGCAFVDSSKTMKMQHEVGLVPYVTNCEFGPGQVHYSADHRGFFPSNCINVPNTALLYGIGSYITGDEYHSGTTDSQTTGPYIKAPRRHLRLTFAKVKWWTGDLAKAFDAECNVGSDEDERSCTGLWYQLQPSGRFLFAGEDALPTEYLASIDFRVPISLVQLNSPTVYLESEGAQITLEPLNQTNFNRGDWGDKPSQSGSDATSRPELEKEQCSMLMDSYLNHVRDNKYVIEQPLQVMYTSFFYYLMQYAAVTPLNDTSLVLSERAKSMTQEFTINQTTVTLLKRGVDTDDRLGNVKLTGDKQVRNIRVSMPPKAYHTSLAGCVLVLVLTLLVVFVPTYRATHFDDDASLALQFVAMRSDTDYPDSVHKKQLVFSATHEAVAFDELAVERLVLVHETERNKKIYM